MESHSYELENEVMYVLEGMLKEGIVKRRFVDGEYRYWFTRKGREMAEELNRRERA